MHDASHTQTRTQRDPRSDRGSQHACSVVVAMTQERCLGKRRAHSTDDGKDPVIGILSEENLEVVKAKVKSKAAE